LAAQASVVVEKVVREECGTVDFPARAVLSGPRAVETRMDAGNTPFGWAAF
jgi:hypothetical protein